MGKSGIKTISKKLRILANWFEKECPEEKITQDELRQWAEEIEDRESLLNELRKTRKVEERLSELLMENLVQEESSNDEILDNRKKGYTFLNENGDIGNKNSPELITNSKTKEYPTKMYHIRE
jgi:aldehyde:ferredoxin oxidoreductase